MIETRISNIFEQEKIIPTQSVFGPKILLNSKLFLNKNLWAQFFRWAPPLYKPLCLSRKLCVSRSPQYKWNTGTPGHLDTGPLGLLNMNTMSFIFQKSHFLKLLVIGKLSKLTVFLSCILISMPGKN